MACVKASLCGLFGLFLVSALSGEPVAAQEVAADCDQLAADPQVRLETIDGDAARLVCEQAVGENPGIPRFLHQYARALERLGDIPTALRLYQWAAADGYAPAQHALGRLIAASANGEPDLQAAHKWFRLAAEQGYLPGVEVVDLIGAAGERSPVAAQVVAVGTDTAALLSWVSAEISPEGYPGALRGAVGTFSAMAGSAADKAMLLGAMIQFADPATAVRFAECRLPESEIDELENSVLAARPNRLQPLIEVAGKFAPEIQNPEIRPIVDGLAAAWRDTVGTVIHQSAEIAAVLAANDVELAAALFERAELRENLSRHFWLQLERDGTWVDLDPTLPRAATGGSRCAAGSTSEFLSETATHRVEVRVVLEERQSGSLRSRTLLERTVRTTDVAGANLTLMTAEPVGRGGEVPDRPSPDGFFTYTPMLQWGDTVVIGESFALPMPLSANAELGDSLGNVVDLFSDSPETTPPADQVNAQPSTDVTALWLHLSLLTPNGPSKTAAVPIFDRIGYVARAAGQQLTVPVARLPEIDGEYQALAAVWNVAVWTGSQRSDDMVGAPQGSDLDRLVTGLTALHGSYDVLRRALYSAARGHNAPRFVEFEPGLSVLGWIPSTNPRAQGGADLVMDVLSNPARRMSDNFENDSTSDFVWAVSSTIAERLIVGMDRMFLGLLGAVDVPAFAPLDVAAVFDLARAQNIELIWLVPDVANVLPIQGSDEAIARIRAHLTEGRSLLVPERAVSIGSHTALGWWLLDTDSHLLRDEFENGRHQGAEYTATNETPRNAGPAYRRFGQRQACFVERAVIVVALAVGVSTGDPGALSNAWDAVKVVLKVRELTEKIQKGSALAQVNKATGQGAACGGGA